MLTALFPVSVAQSAFNMNQLYTQLFDQPFTLLVSLPANDVRLAEAALRGGAQGLKVHINVQHFASGTRFGSLDEERENLTRILEVARAAKASVGIVPGAATDDGTAFATPDEFAALAEMGVDYFDAYPADAPAWTLSQKHLDVMMAAFHGGTIAQMQELEGVGMRLCEASIMHHDHYGKALNALDIATYAALCEALSSPVIVPSQKRIVPADLAALRAAGARGVLIGAIVTGREAESIESAAHAFRNAMN